MVKYTQKPANCLSVFNHFARLAYKGLKDSQTTLPWLQSHLHLTRANCLWYVPVHQMIPLTKPSTVQWSMTVEREKKVDMDSVAKGITSHGQFEDHSEFYCIFPNLEKIEAISQWKSSNFHLIFGPFPFAESVWHNKILGSF